jgi:PHD/YefM family antitoxin component YafN of YafNO toxin-antitoxin module
MKQLRKSKRPVVLTVKGKAAAVVQDAEAYQGLLDIASRASAEKGIHQGLEDAKKGKVRIARAFLQGLRNHAWHISLRSLPVQNATLPTSI